MSEIPASTRTAPRLLLAFLFLSAALAGCTANEERQVTYAGWKQSDPTPQPSVEQIPVTHAIVFAPQSNELNDLEREALLRFLRQSGVEVGDSVVLMAPPPAAGQPDQSAARLAAIRAALARQGIAATALPDGGLPGLPNDEILVTARTLAVVAPDCPGYNAPIAFDFEHRPILNLGCANAANLGLMVAEPADLVEGRPLPPADGEAAVLSIQRYRTGTVWPSSEAQNTVPLRVGTEQ